MLNNVFRVVDDTQLLNLAQHVINNVDLPAGFVQSKLNGVTHTDTTQWVVFKDLTHKKLYYRTYDDLTVRLVTMSQLDFSEQAKPLKMPLNQIYSPIDMTTRFLGKISR